MGNITLLYIEGEMMDLFPDTVIATTLKSFEISNLTSRNATYTNRIKLPKTPNNNRILGFADSIKSSTRKPYLKLTGRLIQNGVELISNASVEVVSVNDSYNIEIYSAVRTLFDKIQDLKLNDIDLGFYSRLDETFLDTYRNDVAPVGAPVIDYGRMLANTTTVSNSFFDINVTGIWTEDTYPGFAWSSSNGYYAFIFSGANQTSTNLIADYKFYKGFQYRLLVNYTVSGTSDPADLFLNATDLTSVEAISIDVATAIGNHTIDATFTANEDWTHISLQADNGATYTGGKTIELHSIEVLPAGDLDVNFPYYMPVIGYNDVVRKIITDAGYTDGIQLFGNDNTLFETLAMSFGNSSIGYPERFLKKINFIASVGVTQVITASSAAQHKINFTTIEQSGSFGWYDGTSTFTYPLASGYNLGLRMYAKLDVTATINAGDTVTITLNDTDYVISTTGTYSFTLAMPLTLLSGTNLDFYVFAVRSSGSGSNTIDINSGTFYSVVDSRPVNIVNISALCLSDSINQTDFFGDFLYRFNCLVKEKDGTIYVKPIQKIIEDIAYATDWTNKRDMSIVDEITFLDSGYAQANTFTDSGDGDNKSSDLEVDNDRLELKKTFYTSIFSAVEEVEYGGRKLSRIPIFSNDSTDPFGVSGDFDGTPRLLYLRDDDTTDPTVTYFGSPPGIGSYLWGVYSDPIAEGRSDWNTFLDNYYRGSLKTALDSMKKVTRYYVLTELDIMKLDFFYPIHDDGSYFLVNTVSNFVPGRSTKVELFKV